ncbi:beta-glucosidase [Novosphingobium bradum]|uniref:Beta-glucosidase n=1 Tax=Novosphingobium bradum TaxID=1737444 RepID=A0ABV7ILM2_9SPHN
MRIVLAAGSALIALMGSPLAAAPGPDEAWRRAEATVKAMTPAEKTVLTHGIMPLPIGPTPPPVPAEAIPGAGYVGGIARLGVPALTETDASLGVAYVMGLRRDGATAMPSGLAMAASWNPDLLERGGRMLGAETRAKGFNVLLAGGANLMRDPRNGRTFEYLSEDPLLTGVLVGHSIRGIQSNHVISTIKHFALNGQETGRKFADVRIPDAAARESDLLAFRIGIEIGQPGSVMCAYNRVHGQQACASDYLLTRVLKQDWGYKGFVMSDWGAVPALDAALGGLDQQSGAQLDPAVFFDKPLSQAAASDPRYAARVDDMNRRVLWAIYANDLDKHPARPGGAIDLAANSEIALETARQGIVLLRNTRNVLPLAATARRIAVIGGHADQGVLSGAGSSQVHGPGGPALVVPVAGTGPWGAFVSEQYHRSSPLAAIKALAPQADVRFRDSRYVRDAVEQARAADVAIIFATKWATEGYDAPDLSLPDNQDALIAAVAEANPNTIVVLETGNPVVMPWLGKTAAVIQAWYPGARGGEAIASVLFGQTNPSGRLPITFPASVDQLPRPRLDGYDAFEPDFSGTPPTPDARLTVDYGIEGSDVGYRWNARRGQKALFPFGFGLSYSTFATSGLTTNGKTASFVVANTGQRAGATTAQLYLVDRNGKPCLRLAGFQRVDLQPGERKTVSLAIDPRLLADWKDGKWAIAGGTYAFALGENAEAIGAPRKVRLAARTWRD